MPTPFINPQIWRMAACLLLLAPISLSSILAQQKEYFPYYSNDTTLFEELAVAQRNSIRSHLVLPQNVSADYRNSYKEIVDKCAEGSYNIVKNDVLFDTLIEPYMQSVFREVISANHDLSSAKLMLTRSPVDNAYALADGTIFFNVGLLAKLENESQIAFILCHELAHYRLSHLEQGITEFLNTIYNKDFKKQYRQVAREKYNRNSKLESFYEEMILGNLYHRRSHEKQADSLGYVLLFKTKYNISDAITALQVLEHSNDPHSIKELDFQEFFNCSDHFYDFTKMKAKSASIFDVAAPENNYSNNPDTLSTHPDIRKRIGYLKELQKTFPIAADKLIFKSDKFENIKTFSQREVVQSWYDRKNYDYALFNAMLLLKVQPESVYLKNMVLLCLYNLKRHMQFHKYAEVVSAESKSHPENFNHLLRVLHNLNSSDFKGLGNCFYKTKKAAQGLDEFSLAAQYALAALNNDEAAATGIKKTLMKTYKVSRFGKMFFSDNLK